MRLPRLRRAGAPVDNRARGHQRIRVHSTGDPARTGERPARALGSARGARGDARRRPQHARAGGSCSSPVRRAPARRRSRDASPTSTRGSRADPVGRVRRALHAARAGPAARRRRGDRRRPRAGRGGRRAGRTRWPAALLRELRAPRPDGPRHRGPALGRRGHPRRRAAAGQEGGHGARARARHLPRRRARPAPPAAGRARRAGQRPAASRAASCRGCRPRPSRSSPSRTASTPTSCYRRTAGNPFFLSEVLGQRRPRDPADGARRRARPRGAPERDGRRRCWAPSPCPSRSAELWLLEALAAETQLACLDECLGSGMLTPTTDGVAFRHELARMTIEETLAPHRRAGAAPRRAGGARRAAGRRARTPRGSRTTPRPPATPPPCCGSRPAAAARADARRRPPRGGRPVRAGAALRRRPARRSSASRCSRAASAPPSAPTTATRRSRRCSEALAVPPGAGRSAARGRPDAPALGRALLPRRPLRPRPSALGATR